MRDSTHVAFPSQTTKPPFCGATLREYFAAHAPEDVPEWFVGEPPEKNYPSQPNWRELSDHLQDAARYWQDGCYTSDDFKDAANTDADREIVVKFMEDTEAYVVGSKEHLLRVVEAKYFQWRYYYADMMLMYSDK